MSMTFGHVTIGKKDVHPVKERLKAALGGTRGLSRLLAGKDTSNFDFWVATDGTVWVGGNNSGGQEKVTTVNFFQRFPEYAPEDDPDWASNRPANWDPYNIPDDSSDEGSDDT